MKVIKIAKPGFNVETEDDPNNLVFDSRLNHLKNKLAGSFTQTVANGATYTKTVAHGLTGKHPLCMAYFRDTSASNWYITMSTYVTPFLNRKSIGLHVEIYSDTTNVYIKVRNSSGSSKEVEVQYEIFYENA